MLAKLAARGDIDPDERVVLVITGEGLKTLDAVRGTFETHDDRAHGRGIRGRCQRGGDGLMSIVVKIPTQLRAAAGGEAEAQVDGATVQEVLNGLFELHEELRVRISDDDGSLRRFVNVYLAGEDIRFLDGLATPVVDGAELTILPAVAGG